MNTIQRLRIWSLSIVCLSIVALPAVTRAQDTAATPPATAPKKAKDKQPPEPTDPWVRAILAAPISTPVERFQAVLSLVNLKQPQRAKQYLRQLLDAKLDAQALAALQQHFGSAAFLALSINPSLQPEGAALTRAVMDAATKLGRDPKRLEQAIAQLGSGDRAQRIRAMRRLVDAGVAAVPVMLPTLKQPANDQQLSALYEVLSALGNDALPPLTAALQASDSALRVAIVRTLGQLKATAAVPELLPLALAPNQDPTIRSAAEKALKQILGNVPTVVEARGFLQKRLDNYLAGSPPGRVDEENRVSIWLWHQPTGTVVRSVVDAADGTLDMVVRAARQLHYLAPQDEKIERLYLVAALEQQQRQAGYDSPLQQSAVTALLGSKNARPELLVALLQDARKHRFPGATIAVLERLAKTGSAALLHSTNGRPSAVAAALLDPNRRVRYQAARAIVAFDPKQPYAGSSYLVDVLGYLASSGGKARVLIGHPKIFMGRQLASQAAGVGFAADIATTGRQLVRQALANPDFSLILIDDAISHPSQGELVQMLRHDPRTSELPIGLIVRDLENYAARSVVASDPRTLAFAMPQTQADMAFEVRRLLKMAGRQWLPPRERIAQAVFALDTLIRLAGDSSTYGFYDLLSQQARIINSFNEGLFSERTARLLGLLGTPEAQIALVEFASQAVRPLAARKAAVAAFKQAVQRRHLLLTRKQVLTQYDRYNASANLDPQTQQVLAGILDVIEMPSQQGKAPAKKAKPKK